MGAKPSVKLSTNVDSVAQPGQKVVVSEPLEVHPNALLDELLDQLRYPVESYKEYVLKACEVTEHGPDDFTVKTILDGKKLDRYRHGRGDGIDRIDVWSRITADRKTRRIMNRPVVPPPGCWVDEVEASKNSDSFACYQLVDSPLRLEFHCVTDKGERWSDEQAVAVVQGTLAAALANMEKRKVKILAEQDSLQGGGLKSVISEPMDAHTDFDAFWDKFLSIMKAPPGSPVKPQIVTVSESEFHTVVTDPASKQTLTTKIQHNRASGEVSTVTFSGDERLNSSNVVLHRKPLQIESWGEDAEGVRWAGRGTAKALQEYVDVVLAKKGHRWFR